MWEVSFSITDSPHLPTPIRKRMHAMYFAGFKHGDL